MHFDGKQWIGGLQTCLLQLDKSNKVLPHQRRFLFDEWVVNMLLLLGDDLDLPSQISLLFSLLIRRKQPRS